MTELNKVLTRRLTSRILNLTNLKQFLKNYTFTYCICFPSFYLFPSHTNGPSWLTLHSLYALRLEVLYVYDGRLFTNIRSSNTLQSLSLKSTTQHKSKTSSHCGGENGKIAHRAKSTCAPKLLPRDINRGWRLLCVCVCM